MEKFIKNFRVKGSDFTSLPEFFDPAYMKSWIEKNRRFNPFALMRRWGRAWDIVWLMAECPPVFSAVIANWQEVTKFLMKEFRISATEALLLLLRGCPRKWVEEYGYDFARAFYKKFKPLGKDFYYLFRAVALIDLLPPEECLKIAKMGCDYTRAAFMLMLYDAATRNYKIRTVHFPYLKENLVIKDAEEIKKALNLIL
ncbi:MAG: hypothetical protein N2595_08885 [bacterium]|nr:hypothetical protein [bacterium]